MTYLAYLGVSLLLTRRGSPGAADLSADEAAAPTRRAVFVKSLLVALSNPKGLLFFSALLPQFVSAQAPQAPQYLALGVTFIAIDTVVMAAYAALGHGALRGLSAARSRLMDRACGATFLALSASLAAYRRASA